MPPRSKTDFKRKVLAAAVLAIGWLAAAPAWTDPVSHTGLPSILHDVQASTSPEISDVTVTTPSLPSAQELAGDGLYQFIVHHATTHYLASATARNLARWRGGKQSICPRT